MAKAPPVDRRRQILDAAVSVFARQGFHACRVSDIAREAGVAYGLVYHYFDSKDQVLNELFEERFPEGSYTDVTGLCKVATIEEIETQGWSLNPGRYVGTEVEELEDEEFEEKLAAAQVELRALGERAAKLEAGVDDVLTQLLSH